MLKNGKDGHDSEPHSRSAYVDHSRKFKDWVNGLGLERTIVGRLARDLDRRFSINRILLLFLICLSFSYLLLVEVDVVYTGYRLGDVVHSDIKSPVTFDVADDMATAQKRLDAEMGVPPIYDFDTFAYDSLANNIVRGFREMRRQIVKLKWPTQEPAYSEAVKNFAQHKEYFEEILGRGQLSERGFEWLASERFNIRIENAVVTLLELLSSKRIAGETDALRQRGNDKIIVRVVDRRNTGEEFTVPVVELTDLYDVKRQASDYAPIARLKLKQEDQKLFLSFIDDIIVANLTLNKQETAVRQQRARDAVLPVNLSVKKGQVVVKEGSIVQPVHLIVLDEIQSRQTRRQRDIVLLVVAALLVTVILVYHSYLRRFTANRVKVLKKDLGAMVVVTVFVALIAKLFLFVSTAAFQERFGIIPFNAYTYLVPFAAGPMLVGLLMSYGEIVWIYTTFFAIALSLSVEGHYGFLIVSLVGGIAAARGVYSCKKRNDIYLAGLRAGAVNMLLIGLVTVIETDRRDELFNQLLWNMPAGLLSGVFSSFVAMFCIPFLESVFNYTTDVKLLELSNLNHPLLKEMFLKASGTYHHSLVVGSMVEAAAEAIGANPLLAKVSAYYHDIGKTEHAGYFIENQKGGYNPHDHISPNMSKTVLVAHVKDGVELGHEYKLGKPIIDVIIQHHGTTLISFFYHKAKQNEDETMHSAEEDDFRYPGPKPQFKEAALCM